MSEHSIVISSADTPTGTIVSGDLTRFRLARQRTLLLPVDIDALRAQGPAASTAFQLRDYGADRRVFEWGVSHRDCFLPVWFEQACVRVEWIAKVAGNASSGRLLLAPAPAPGRITCDVQESCGVDFAILPHDFDGILRGSAKLYSFAQTFGVVCLRGAIAPAVAVEWIAMTVLPNR